MAIPKAALGDRRQGGRYHAGFPVRCTEAEKQLIFARAERASRSASRFLVELAVADSDSVAARPSRQELEVLEGLMVQLRRLASCLHELASRDHAAIGDERDIQLTIEIDEAVLELRELLNQLRARLL